MAKVSETARRVEQARRVAARCRKDAPRVRGEHREWLEDEAARCERAAADVLETLVWELRESAGEPTHCPAKAAEIPGMRADAYEYLGQVIARADGMRADYLEAARAWRAFERGERATARLRGAQ